VTIRVPTAFVSHARAVRGGGLAGVSWGSQGPLPQSFCNALDKPAHLLQPVDPSVQQGIQHLERVVAHVKVRDARRLWLEQTKE
jgi:hypothetical protein